MSVPLHMSRRLAVALAAAAVAVPLVTSYGVSAALASAAPRPTFVYTETNAATGNTVLAFRDDNGTLSSIGSFVTGGAGSGAGLGSQGAVTLSGDGRYLLAVNAGSASVSAFRVGVDGSLALLGSASSGGAGPVSVTEHDGLVYVLDAGSGSVAGLTLSGDGLAVVPGAVASLSDGAAGPAQVSFTPDGKHLLVTEKASNTLDVFRVHGDGRVSAPRSTDATGATPFGFAFTTSGVAVVSDAAGGAAGATALTSYIIRGSNAAQAVTYAPSGQTAACWVVVTRSGYAFSTNAGSGTVSSYAVSDDGGLSLVGASATTTAAHPTDEALGAGDSALYVLSAQTGTIDVATVGAGGSLGAATAGTSGLPTSAVGLAATG